MESRVTQLEDVSDSFWDAVARIQSENAEKELDRSSKILFDRNEFPFTVNLGSKDRPDFAVSIDDNQKSDHFYSRSDYQPLQFSEQHFGLLDSSAEKVTEQIEFRIAEIETSSLRQELNSTDLSQLQETVIKEATDPRRLFKTGLGLFSGNDVASNYQFDYLSGELVGIEPVKIEPSFKEYCGSSGHHELPKQVAGYKKKTRLDNQFRDANAMVTDARIKNEVGMLEEKYKARIEPQRKLNDLNEKEFKDFVIGVLETCSLSSDASSLLATQTLVSHEKKHHSELENVSQTEEAKRIEEEEKKDEQKEDNKLISANLLDFVIERREASDELDALESSYVSRSDYEERKQEIAGLISSEKASEETLASGILKTNLSGVQSLVKKVEKTSAQPTNTQNKWAFMDEFDITKFYDILPKNKMAINYPFELDVFQKRAVLRLENKESVFVAAHTSAGKTVVAEYAIALAKKHMTKAIYTSPIKALSNQKYHDFLHKFGDVGILTGDVSLNPKASCLIVTTEVLRSMLYKGSDIIRDIEWVIFDEVHYVNNAERGVVWEETIILLPEHVGIIMLSATVPNALEFANWVGMTKRRNIYVQMTYHRPTPLEHSIYVEDHFQVIKNKEAPFNAKEYEAMIDSIQKAKKQHQEYRDKRNQDRKEKFEEKGWEDKRKKKKEFLLQKNLNIATKDYNAGKAIKTNMAAYSNTHLKMKEEIGSFKKLVQHCNKQKLLPAVFFVFSKKRCMDIAFGLGDLGLTTKQEYRKITHFFDDAMKRLKPVDRELPQLIGLKGLLQQGIAVHHGDLLPVAKEIVEILFSQGLIKVLFATETFAMGVNMPAKTVVFTGIKKSDGKEYRFLKSSEYTQMAGRAGRRGIDEKGTVIIFMKRFEDLPRANDLKAIVDHKGEQLESKFRLTYQIIFNLVLSKDLKVTDLMQRSYTEASKTSMIPVNQQKLITNRKKKHDVEKNLTCDFVSIYEPVPIVAFYDNLKSARSTCKKLWENSGNFIAYIEKDLPKIIVFLSEQAHMMYGILFKVSAGSGIRKFGILYLGEDDKHIQIQYEDQPKTLDSADKYMSEQMTGFYKEFDEENIVDVLEPKFGLKKQANADPQKKDWSDYAELLKKNSEKIAKAYSDTKNSLLYNYSLKNTGNMLELYTGLRKLVQDLRESLCFNCEKKLLHLQQRKEILALDVEIKALEHELKDTNLSHMDEFEGRKAVLRAFEYIDKDDQPLLKARVAREVASSDIYLSEVIMENILEGLTPAEIAALLSAFVCQAKIKDFQPPEDLPEALQDAIDRTYEVCRKIQDEEAKYHLFDKEEDEEENLATKFNLSLVQVVYEWASQKNFSEICQLTEAQEGSIVRTILRLDILLRDVKNACRLMGNMSLFKIIDEASHLIRRDIVFASSLYLE